MKPQSQFLAFLGLAVLGSMSNAHAFRVTDVTPPTNPGNARIERVVVEDSDVAGMDEQQARRFRESFQSAYRDESDMIWGNKVTDEAREDRVRTLWMTYSQARDYCEGLNPDASERRRIKEALDHDQDPGHGIFLPRISDFERLVRYMANYRQQILPNLADSIYWSSTVNPDDSDRAYFFIASSGFLHVSSGLLDYPEGVLCVVR